MKRIVFLALISLGHVKNAYACKCGWESSVRESFQSADLVLHGKAVRIDTVRFSETIGPKDIQRTRERLKDDGRILRFFEMTNVLRVEFHVLEKYKGDHRRKVVIYTPLLSASCGYRFKEGGEYIVYASQRNFFSGIFGLQDEHDGSAGFWTTHCTRTAEYAKSEADQLIALKG